MEESKCLDLRVELPGLSMKNPLMTASGTFGFGEEYGALYPLRLLGGLTTKAVTKEARRGNPMPRIAETPGGMLNAIGLMNPGCEAVKEKLSRLAREDTAVLVNIAGSTEEEYLYTADCVSKMEGVTALEVNISCPNVKAGGITFGQDPLLVESLTRKLKSVTDLPIYMKLSPNVTDIVSLARAAEAGGADGLSMINTLLGMRLDLAKGRPIIQNGTGGLSGPCIKPVAIRMIYQVYRAVKIPIIGMGGIMTAEDVLEFLYAGASAVAVGTANFIHPYIMPQLVATLPQVLRKYGFTSVKQAVGFAHREE